MIKDLIQQGSNIVVQSTVQPYVANNNSMNQFAGATAGQVRMNLQTQCFEVFDGMTWVNVTTTATVDLSMSANDAIAWARQKMQEERELQQKMDKHPSLKAAFEQFKIVEALVNEYDSNPG